MPLFFKVFSSFFLCLQFRRFLFLPIIIEGIFPRRARSSAILRSRIYVSMAVTIARVFDFSFDIF